MAPIPQKAKRAWADGCYDMMHFGHANSLRQANEMCEHLVVGVHSDAEIARHKGPPVMNEQERYRMVRACKWADEVVEGVPYVTSVHTLNTYECEICVHGDDITLSADGSDSYAEVKQANRYRECKRTSGISSTDLIGRMMLLTKRHHIMADPQEQSLQGSPCTSTTGCLSAENGLAQFLSDQQPPKPGDRVVYIGAGFDLFHVGHLDLLEAAKNHGDYVVVGLHDDKTINSYMGLNYPIMNINERALGLLACQYADAVIMGAPLEVSTQILDQFNVSTVLHGTGWEDMSLDAGKRRTIYAEAIKKGIYKEVDMGQSLSTPQVLERITRQYQSYVRRNRRKQTREREAYEALMRTAASTNATSTRSLSSSSSSDAGQEQDELSHQPPATELQGAL
eukprot:Clim_evm42s44 gene=Clim_evmTU42s44